MNNIIQTPRPERVDTVRDRQIRHVAAKCRLPFSIAAVVAELALRGATERA